MIDYADPVPLQLRQMDRPELLERHGEATRILRHAIRNQNWRLVESAGLMMARIARRIRLQEVQEIALASTRGLTLARDPEATVTATGLSRGDTLTVRLTAEQHWVLFSVGRISAAAMARYQ